VCVQEDLVGSVHCGLKLQSIYTPLHLVSLRDKVGHGEVQSNINSLHLLISRYRESLKME
jgi:hypothetical protein